MQHAPPPRRVEKLQSSLQNTPSTPPTNVYTLADIRQRLSVHQPDQLQPDAATRQAATALVLRENNDQTEVLFIKRAAAPNDPWSGHMAFPGGHRDPQDKSLIAAAIRETFEEIGLDLKQTDFIGSLSHQQAAPRGRTINMLIAPFVFETKGNPSFTPNHEVDDVVWGSMSDMVQGLNHEIQEYAIGDQKTRFNGYRLGESHFVWGLTYRTLQSFFSVIVPNYNVPVEPSY